MPRVAEKEKEIEIEKEPQATALILLVEDNPDRSSRAKTILGQDYDVETVKNAESTLALLEKAEPIPNLVFTSLYFEDAGGKMNGLELAKKIRSHQRVEINSLAIVLTTHLDKTALETEHPGVLELLELNYLSKSANIDETLSLIKTILNPQT